MIDGSVECGPTAVLSHVSGALALRGSPPAGNMARVARAQSPKMLLDSLRRLVPSVALEDLRPGPSGVRAQAMRADGCSCRISTSCREQGWSTC